MTAATERPVRVRFPPSPTGPITLGNVRSALFNWLFVRQAGGTFVLRFEDTDPERSQAKYEPLITEALGWLGLDWDEGPQLHLEAGEWHYSEKGDFGPYRQSARAPLYRKYLQQLLDEGKAYYCYCTKEELEARAQAMAAQGLHPKYGGHCRTITEPPAGRNIEQAVIRLKVPEAKIEFNDLVRGKVEFDGSLLGDIIIARNLDSALYHFAVVVDDELMDITHVIRGEDHISNTPKHIALQKALGFREPVYGHLPFMLGPDKKKLSKRTAEISILEYREKGYLPQAMVNFLALLGWHPKGDEEILNPEELIKRFDIKRVQKAGAVFNAEKLDWVNAQHIRRLSLEEFVEALRPFLAKAELEADENFLRKIAAIEKERIKTLDEFVKNADFFFRVPDYDANLLVWRDDPRDKTKMVLQAVEQILNQAKPEDFANRETMLAHFQQLIAKEGRGSVLWPLRVAVSGKSASPDPLEIMEILGKEETLKRVRHAMDKLSRIIV